ncbi:MAG TPA: DUF5666 domain-containing protein [Candidatus Sulfotelmatobacter sp.]|nr:DUF5666 domain-containing protein [Candidatus Sulfotelmatobacter sp.]
MEAIRAKIGAMVLAFAMGTMFSVAVPVFAQETSAPSTAKRIVGAVKSIGGNAIVLTTDSGSDVNVAVQESTRIVRIAAGEKNLKNATPIQLSDLQVGDRILVGGAASADGQSVTASSIVVMKRSDVESLHQQQEQDWQKRGLGGMVESVDPSSSTVTISQASFSGKKSVVVHASKQTVIRRYAPDSVKFEDAKASSLDQIRPGDQLRVRGDRNADGTEVSADEIVSGTFRNLAGIVNSVDAGSSALSVQDLLSKKLVQVKVSGDSQLRKIPPEMAQRIAMRLKGANGAASGAQARGAAAGAANQDSTQGQPSSEPAHTQGAMQTGMHSGGAPDFQQMLSRMPTIALADLHKGDAVLVLTTEGTPESAPSAITLLSGVEPILQAAPGGSQAALLAPWNLGGAPGGDLGQ